MQKILLTGSSGFVGFNILKKLINNNKIFLILRKKNNAKIDKLKKKNIKKIYYKNPNQLNKSLKKIKVDVVIHCATHYVKKHKFSDIKKFNDSNIFFGNLILENLKNMKVKKFINFSTVWEDYSGIKDNFANLYSAYKKAFGIILNHYKNNNSKIKFYNILLSETFGQNDKRRKLINVLKNNYKKNKVSKIVSKNLRMNLLNIEDIVCAIEILIKKQIIPGKYVIKNNKNYKVYDLILKFNSSSKKKIKIKWLSTKTIYEKIFNYKVLPKWSPKLSKINNVIKNIKD